jgi:hypothetical protein
MLDLTWTNGGATVTIRDVNKLTDLTWTNEGPGAKVDAHPFYVRRGSAPWMQSTTFSQPSVNSEYDSAAGEQDKRST